MEQDKRKGGFREEKKFKSEQERMFVVESNLISAGRRLNAEFHLQENLEKILEKENIRSFTVGSKEDYYDKLFFTKKVEFRKKKQKWETDARDFWAEKTLRHRELNKGEEIDENTYLMFTKSVGLISKKVKKGDRLDLLSTKFSPSDRELGELAGKSFIDLEKEARREVMEQIITDLSPEEKNKYADVYQKVVVEFKTNIEESDMPWNERRKGMVNPQRN